MPERTYSVILTDAERQTLQAVLASSTVGGRKNLRARILLLVADTGASDPAIAEVLHTTKWTVQRTRKKFAQGGVTAALTEQPRTGAPRRLSEDLEQLLVALASDAPPAGHPVWTMQLLADNLVAFGLVDRLSDETVRRVLKKTPASPG